MANITRVAIVNDQPIFRIGLRSLLRNSTDIAIVAEGGHAREAEELARAHQPDIFLFDISTNQSGSRTVIDFIAGHPKIKAVMITDAGGDACAMTALSAGAQGYMLKATPPDEFVTALREIADGRPYISPSLATGLLVKTSGTASPPPASMDRSGLEALNARERRVLSLASKGHTNKEIADELGLATQTIKNHMSTIIRKLNVRRRSGAISLFLSDRRSGADRNGRRATD